MKLHATVMLRVDLPEHGLVRGMLGAIVVVFEAPERAYEVEFVDARGRTVAEVTLREEHLDLVERGP